MSWGLSDYGSSDGSGDECSSHVPYPSGIPAIKSNNKHVWLRPACHYSIYQQSESAVSPEYRSASIPHWFILLTPASVIPVTLPPLTNGIFLIQMVTSGLVMRTQLTGPCPSLTETSWQESIWDRSVELWDRILYICQNSSLAFKCHVMPLLCMKQYVYLTVC